MITIYTVGYKNFSFYDFQTKIEELEATVVDIRLMPTSWYAFWRQGPLREAFKESYVHIPELGNKNYGKKGGPISIANIKVGLEKIWQLISAGKIVVLLCACNDYNLCHRKVVALAMQHFLEQKKEECKLIELLPEDL